MTQYVSARWLVQSPEEVLPSGRLGVDDRGRVIECAPAMEAGPDQDGWLGEVAILPGYVNAHAHLELPALGELDGSAFVPWVGKVLERRGRMGELEYARQVEAGARRALATGTTALGEVNSSGAGLAPLADLPLRTILYREVLDGDNADRTEDQLALLEAGAPPGLTLGLSPHGPHTVSDRLLRACAEAARARGLALTIHWAETPEEVRWLTAGEGAFAPFFGRFPGCTGLERLERAGLLDLPLSLVHGNCPGPGELEGVARRGLSLVHCPGTHAYFDRPPVPVNEWLERGLSIALGTDSLASNGDLDMGREMSLLREQHPGLSAATVFGWATRGGARALSLQNQIGDLAVGKWADFIAVDASGMETPEDVLEAVTGSRPEVLGVWIAGRQIWGEEWPVNRL